METPANGAVPSPPVRLVDNPATWLGFTDLVFVDPVGTGFSRGKGKEENPDKPFWDVRADIASLGTVIRLWLTRHRALELRRSISSARAMAVSAPRRWRKSCRMMSASRSSGLVLVSPALDLSALHQDERDLLAAAFVLPSYAATAAAADADACERKTGQRSSVLPYRITSSGSPVSKAQPTPGDPFIAKVAALRGTP